MPLHERLYLFQCEPQLLTLLDETDVVQITFRVNAVSGRRVQWLAQNSLGFFGRDSDFWLSNALILYLRMGLRIRRANRRTGRRIDWQMSMAAGERGVPLTNVIRVGKRRFRFVGEMPPRNIRPASARYEENSQSLGTCTDGIGRRQFPSLSRKCSLGPGWSRARQTIRPGRLAHIRDCSTGNRVRNIRKCQHRGSERRWTSRHRVGERPSLAGTKPDFFRRRQRKLFSRTRPSQ